MKTVETLLNDQLAACLAAMQDCLAHSRKHTDDEYGEGRREDAATMARLMKASALLTASLAKLNGESRHTIRVVRDVGG